MKGRNTWLSEFIMPLEVLHCMLMCFPGPDPHTDGSGLGAHLARPPAHTPSEAELFLSLGYPWEPRAWTAAGGVGHVGLFFP